MRYAECAPPAVKGLAEQRLGRGQLALSLEQAREGVRVCVTETAPAAEVRVAKIRF